MSRSGDAMIKRFRHKHRPPGAPRPSVEQFMQHMKPLYDDGIVADTEDDRVYLTDYGVRLSYLHGYHGMDDAAEFITYLLAQRDEKEEVYKRITKGAT